MKDAYEAVDTSEARELLDILDGSADEDKLLLDSLEGSTDEDRALLDEERDTGRLPALRPDRRVIPVELPIFEESILLALASSTLARSDRLALRLMHPLLAALRSLQYTVYCSRADAFRMGSTSDSATTTPM